MAGSWNRKGHPIIMAEQMKHPIQWNPMKDEWKASHQHSKGLVLEHEQVL